MNILSWIITITLISATIKQVKDSPAQINCRVFSTEIYDQSRYDCIDGLLYEKGETRKDKNLGPCPEGLYGWVKTRAQCLVEDKAVDYIWLIAKSVSAFLLPYFVPAPVRIVVHAILNALNVDAGWFTAGSRLAQLGVGVSVVLFVLSGYAGGSSKRKANGRFSK